MPRTRHVNLTVCCNSRAIALLVRFFTIPLEIALKVSVCSSFVQHMDERSRIWIGFARSIALQPLVTGTRRSLQVYFLCLEK